MGNFLMKLELCIGSEHAMATMHTGGTSTLFCLVQTPLPYTELSHNHQTQQLLTRKQGSLLMILIATFPIETV